MPRISVIIPVYNTEKYLRKCIDSVIFQDFKDIEIIICNDGSDDSSGEIISAYKKTDERIVVIEHDETQGLSVSRNDGIEIAQGDYIVFIDSDDYISNNMLSDIYEKICETRADVLFFGYREHSCKNENITTDIKRTSCYPKVKDGVDFFCESINEQELLVYSWGAIYNALFLRENNLKYKPKILHEDTLFYYKLLMRARRVTSIENCYYEYVRRGDSLTMSKNLQREKLISLCDIVNEIHELSMHSEYRVKKYTNTYLKLLMRLMGRYYKNINSIEGDVTIEQDYLLKLISASLYNGYFTYKLPEKVIESIKTYQRVIIYGAGRVAIGLSQLLKEYNIKVEKFLISNDSKQELMIEGIPVRQIDYVDDKGDIIVIIGAGKRYITQIYDNALDYGYKHVMDVSEYI